MPYSPLGRGFLTGVYTSTDGLTADDSRHAYPRFEGENARHNAALLKPIQDIAEAHDASAGQVALAWLTEQAKRRGLATVPIPGTKRRARLEENVAALDSRLADAELATLEPIAEQVAGARLPMLPPELRRMPPDNG